MGVVFDNPCDMGNWFSGGLVIVTSARIEMCVDKYDSQFATIIFEREEDGFSEPLVFVARFSSRQQENTNAAYYQKTCKPDK